MKVRKDLWWMLALALSMLFVNTAFPNDITTMFLIYPASLILVLGTMECLWDSSD